MSIEYYFTNVSNQHDVINVFIKHDVTNVSIQNGVTNVFIPFSMTSQMYPFSMTSQLTRHPILTAGCMLNLINTSYPTPYANNESSEVFDIFKPGQRDKIKGYRQ